jgi:hypothetical protein
VIRSVIGIALIAVLALAPCSVSAQTRLPRTAITAPTVLAPVTSIRGRNLIGKVMIIFLPATGATGYRLTRVDNSIVAPPETVVAEGPPCTFADCYSGLTPPMGLIRECNPAKVTQPEGECWYWDYEVVRGHSYSYRVWALYPNGAVASPSPVFTLTYEPQ